MSSRREQFFASLFDRQSMRKRYPHRDTALSAYLQDLGELPVLTPQQEADFLARAASGDADAQQQRVVANLRLVIAIATPFQGRGLAMLDLIQEGNLGLLKAIQRFDFKKANRLSTYAKYWILSAVSRAVAGQGKIIHAPYRTNEQIRQIERTLSDFQQQGVEPDTRKIAEHVGLPVEQVTELLTLMQEPLSLSKRQKEQDSLESIIAAPPLLLTNEVTTPSLLADVRQMIRKVLTEDERLVIEHRFGLTEEGIVYEYREIAATVYQRRGSRADERIRQLEQSGLAKLRAAFEGEEG